MVSVCLSFTNDLLDGPDTPLRLRRSVLIGPRFRVGTGETAVWERAAPLVPMLKHGPDTPLRLRRSALPGPLFRVGTGETAVWERGRPQCGNPHGSCQISTRFPVNTGI